MASDPTPSDASPPAPQPSGSPSSPEETLLGAQPPGVPDPPPPRSPPLPSRTAVGGFVWGEILSGAAGWTAGLAGSWLVSQFFVARGIRNLWGLAARGDRTVVSHDTYAWLGTISEYVVGLIVLLVVQQLVDRALRRAGMLRADPDPVGPSAG